MEGRVENVQIEMQHYFDMSLAREATISEIGDGLGPDAIDEAEVYTMENDQGERANNDENEIDEEIMSDTHIPIINHSKFRCLIFSCVRSKLKLPQEHKEELPQIVEEYTESCNFFRCPFEVRAFIFSFLSESELMVSRKVCFIWKQEIDAEILSCSTTLTLAKGSKFLKLSRKKQWKLRVKHYTIEAFDDRSCTKKLFKRLPIPSSLHLAGPISSKNFCRMIYFWRNIYSLSLGTEVLTTNHLFWDWKAYYPSEYFPQLKYLEIKIDRSKLNNKEFVPRTLRYNLDILLVNPYEHLRTLKYEMVNIGHHYPCAFIAPILMLIGRSSQTIAEVSIIFHTGLEIIESQPPLEMVSAHAPTNFTPVADELYVHRECNLQKLNHVQLKSLHLHIPSIDGCRTKSAICNYFKNLIDSQEGLREFVLETDAGIAIDFLKGILTRCNNSKNLTILDVTLRGQDFRRQHRSRNIMVVKPFNMSTFAYCVSLKSLRLKRIGVTEHTSLPHINGIDHLPIGLEKLFLAKLNIQWKDLYGIVKGLSNLQCLFIDRCDILGKIWRNEELISRTLIAICFHSCLKFVSICTAKRNSLHEICLRLTSGEENAYALTKLGWKWFLIVKGFQTDHSERLIFHKGKEHCKTIWFETYVYERISY